MGEKERERERENFFTRPLLPLTLSSTTMLRPQINYVSPYFPLIYLCDHLRSFDPFAEMRQSVIRAYAYAHLSLSLPPGKID